MQNLLGIDTTIEATMLVIDHLSTPKAQDVALNNILHFAS
jgi:hypothetical protein